MTDSNTLTRHRPHCGEQFGYAWVGVGLQAHLWKVHGIQREATFRGASTLKVARHYSI